MIYCFQNNEFYQCNQIKTKRAVSYFTFSGYRELTERILNTINLNGF